MYKEWFLVIEGEEAGPYTEIEIINMLRKKEIKVETEIFKKGETIRLISEVKEFSDWNFEKIDLANDDFKVSYVDEETVDEKIIDKKTRSEISNEKELEKTENKGKEVDKEIGKEIGKEVGEEVGKEIGKEVGEEVGKEVGEEVGKEVGEEVDKEKNDRKGQTLKAKNSHDIKYRILGEEMQYVEIELNPKETVIAEAGAMMYMNDNIVMETIFGDGSKSSDETGFLERFLDAGKRVLVGETMFMTAFSNKGNGKRCVAFASPFPGRIIPLDLTKYAGKVVCQKDAFLCAAKGVAIGIEVNRNLKAGLMGGEGFIMQKLEGDGLAFIHACGTVSEIVLKEGEVLKIDTGCLVGFTRKVKYEIEFVRGIKSMFFGGEGIAFARVTGPGSAWVQSLPFSRLSARIFSGVYEQNNRGQGSILGSFLGGDRKY